MKYWKYDGYRNSYLRTFWAAMVMLSASLVLPRLIASPFAQRLNPLIPAVFAGFFGIGFVIAAYVRMRIIRRILAQSQRATARIIDAQRRPAVFLGLRPFTLTVQYDIDGSTYTSSCFLEGHHERLGTEVRIAVSSSNPSKIWPLLEDWTS